MMYTIRPSIGKFADEAGFKKKFMAVLKEEITYCGDIIPIENTVEPGMPDLLVISCDETTKFIELKYSRKGIFTFKKSQIPWYRRHRQREIQIVVYNDLTTNIHTISAEYILANCTSNRFKLKDEKEII